MSKSTQNWKDALAEMEKAIERETKSALHAIDDDFKASGTLFNAEFRILFVDTVTKGATETYNEFQNGLHRKGELDGCGGPSSAVQLTDIKNAIKNATIIALRAIDDDFKTSGMSFDDEFQKHFLEIITKRATETYDEFQNDLHQKGELDGCGGPSSAAQSLSASNTMNVSGADNEVSQTNILELNVDCCEEMSKWIPLSDLKAFRQTCKRLKTIFNHCIILTYSKRFGKLDVFDHGRSKDLRSFDTSFGQLYKHIHFVHNSISAEVIQSIKPILSTVEKVTIKEGTTKVDFYNDFLLLCTNLKHLYIRDVHSFDNNWLLHKFPTLEHLILLNDSNEQPELETCFELNPSIRRFSTDDEFVIGNEKWMKKSNVHLDELDVQCDSKDMPLAIIRELFEKGFYKRLNLYYYDDFDQECFNSIATLNGLDALYFNGDCFGDLVRTPMPQLKEFGMDDASRIGDVLNILFESFVNIERIQFESANFNSILPFIRHSAKLKKVKIQNPSNDAIYCNDGIIDFSALHRERKKCAAASKVTIYVGEEVYLKTKEAFMTTDIDLIELKRAESLVWEGNIFQL